MTVVHDLSEADRADAASAVARLLSAFAFVYDLVIDVESAYYNTGSGEVDPFHPAAHRAIDQFPSGGAIRPAPACVVVEDDPRARLALALYREGVNATSPYLGFVAFWSVLDE